MDRTKRLLLLVSASLLSETRITGAQQAPPSGVVADGPPAPSQEVLDIAEMIRHELIDVDMGHSITEAELAKRGELGNKSPELIHAALAYELGIGLVKRINPGTAAEPFRYYDPGTSTG